MADILKNMLIAEDLRRSRHEKGKEKDDESDEVEEQEEEEVMKRKAKEEGKRVSQFQVRPKYEQKFPQQMVKEMIKAVLAEHLNGRVYIEEETEELIKLIANNIRENAEEQMNTRYKLIVNVVMGEHRGTGVKSGCRCLWDPEADDYASNVFVNDSIFCVATVFGIYFY